MNAAGYSEEEQKINQTTEDVSHSAQGHKANISNPNTSEKSKKHSKEELEKLGGEAAFYGKQGLGE
ncbi:uncharacterized protein BDZ99DRAFT_464742 [Mytilinidion resinicola]|uniref:Conidiation-specific protein 6 n=1 Tax=Mytilinidion resinicola TaxID=574789 RepID=A0A6A6YGA4_9PEZI|nr:uncharacterized protein BDZ99DRAFT_464742 [Mytilinidion resinicola]KAF2807831.1 hypothetical protein BDZ99DRAFT_464742 [Mytilinidion resinicola]